MRARLTCAAVALLIAQTVHANERQPVDAAVVLLVDASGSMSAAELMLARESHRLALTSNEVLSAIANGEQGRIAVAYVEFADTVDVRIDWTIIQGPRSAQAFADRIAVETGPVPGSMTGIGLALVAADFLFDSLPYDSPRLVVDIVGDGSNNLAPHPFVGRRPLLARGAVINAMPLMLSPDEDGIDAYFAAEVVGGAGNFVMPVTAPDRMATALRSKIVLELY